MRSRTNYIMTKEEVYKYSENWLSTALRLDYEGRKCTTSVLFRILMIAVGRVVSLLVTLPDIRELERRLNHSLCHQLPKALLRKSCIVAIDLTLIPYHGQPALDIKEIFRSKPKSGTSHFHAYATAAVVHKGDRYTVALIHVEYGASMKEVVQQFGEAYSPAGHQDPPFAAGQGVLQRQGAFVSEAGGARVHYYRCCCGDARRKTRKPHRPGCGHC